MNLINKFSAQTIIGKIIRYPLKFLPKKMVVKVKSGINKGRLWRISSSTHGCWLGTYEEDKQKVVMRYTKESDRVLDIGANAGFYTLAFSKLIGPNGKVWSFEPFCDNLSNLNFHINANKLKNVIVVAAAISNKSSLVDFICGSNNATGQISYENKNENNRNFLIPTISLDDIIKSKLIEVPNLVKMDVEGAESNVLEGAKLILDERKTIWLVAIHGEDQLNQVTKIFKSYDYKVKRLDGEILPSNEYCDEIIAFP